MLQGYSKYDGIPARCNLGVVAYQRRCIKPARILSKWGPTLPDYAGPSSIVLLLLPLDLTMRLPIYATALAATASALAIGERASSEDRYVLELAPGVTKVVTEAEKWALKAVSTISRQERLPECGCVFSRSSFYAGRQAVL